MVYRLGRKAEQDIIELFLQGAERFGVLQAEACHDLLTRTFAFLADNPEAARLREEIDPPVRIHPLQAHRVIYRIEEDGSVSITRVRHAHEDWSVGED